MILSASSHLRLSAPTRDADKEDPNRHLQQFDRFGFFDHIFRFFKADSPPLNVGDGVPQLRHLPLEVGLAPHRVADRPHLCHLKWQKI